MKLSALFPITLACLALFPLWVSGQEEDESRNYFREFGTAPVEVFNRTGVSTGQGQRLFLMGTDRGDLIFRYQPNDIREIGIPLDTRDLQLFYQTPSSYDDALELIEAEDFAGGLQELRPIAYPLIRFLSIPPQNFNIHDPVERMVYALSRSDYLDEAVTVVRRLPLQSLPPVFLSHSLFLLERLAQEGQTEDAIGIIATVPLSVERPDSLFMVMNFANKIRDEGKINEALLLYQRLQDIPHPDIQNIARLWTAYCNIQLNRAQTAEVFLERVAELQPEDRAFSLKKLVQGLAYLKRDNYLGAMREVSQGVVFSEVAYPWNAELLYMSGLCYEKLDNLNTARQVYGEVVLFYPESPWAAKCEEHLAQLPSPTAEATN